jgi:hypothetical protein
MKESAPRRILRPRDNPPPETMLTKIEDCNLTGSRLDACPTVGANYRVNGSDSRDGGYVGEGRVLATARLYAQFYEFRPLSEEVTALRLGAAEACRLECCLITRGANPCARGEG